MYDYAHPISDALENITHSICTLEFEDHRPLYEWVLNEIGLFPNPPVQIEFARLELTNTVMSKRKLRVLVEEGKVSGWDDPRMPTLSGLRRRGYTPSSIRDFSERIGVAKNNSVVDIALLEHCLREELNRDAQRVMGVLDPIKLVLTNYPEDKVEYMEVENNQNDPSVGTRMVPFSRELYIEREDFMENPPRKYFRLSPGKEVRLKNAYIIRCDEVIKDQETGEILEIHCSYDPDTKSGSGSANRKVKGTLHWVSAAHAIPATIRLYDYLFIEDENGEMQYNPDSIKVLKGYVEPSLKDTEGGVRFQFFRQGYFCTDIKDSKPDDLVFNQIVPLKSSYKPEK
jgi:glutaminyl-tRNA synthetase